MNFKTTILLFSFLTIFFQTNAQTGLDFDGVDDYIQTNYTGLTGSNARTIEAWIKTGVVGAQDVLVDMGTMPNGTRFTLNVLNGYLRIEIGGGGINSTTLIADNQWHHVAVTYDGGLVSNQFKLYIDGTMNISGNISAVATNTAAGVGLMIGRRNDGINYFLGKMDEVRVWNLERTAAQIQASMNTELCGATGLVAYYRFNEGTPGANNTAMTTVTDNSGNTNTGVMNNFTRNGNTSNWTTGVTLANSSGSGSSATITASACGSYTAPSGNFTTTVSGTFNDTIANFQGCDSILTIIVTINPNTTSLLPVTACGIYVAPNGDTYTSSQTFTHIIPNAAGCDSIITINLTILNPSSTLNETACDSYTAPSGAVYTTSQTFTDIIPSAFGCDSVITINLTIITVDTTVTFDSISITANQSNATYQWYNCENGMFTIIPNATSQTYNVTTLGYYSVAITYNSCVQMSSCMFFQPLSTQSQLLRSEVSIFPNPTLGDFTIDLGKTYTSVNIEITGIDGKVVAREQLNNANRIPLKLNAPLGIYQIKIMADNEMAYFRILKQ